MNMWVWSIGDILEVIGNVYLELVGFKEVVLWFFCREIIVEVMGFCVVVKRERGRRGE